MDQKHAMLYPPLDPGNNNAMSHDQRNSASAAIGLPTEAPPSYDMAMSTPGSPGHFAATPAGPSTSTQATAGWMPSAPNASPEVFVQTQPQPSPYPPNRPPPMSVIVEQPLPPQPQPQPQQQQHFPTVPSSADATSPIPPKLGPNPCAVTCPACGTSKTTRMSYTPNSRTHLSALLLCLVGWCCCACCVPYCMNSCRTGNHYCAKCNTFLGAFNPRANK